MIDKFICLSHCLQCVCVCCPTSQVMVIVRSTLSRPEKRWAYLACLFLSFLPPHDTHSYTSRPWTNFAYEFDPGDSSSYGDAMCWGPPSWNSCVVCSVSLSPQKIRAVPDRFGRWVCLRIRSPPERCCVFFLQFIICPPWNCHKLPLAIHQFSGILTHSFRQGMQSLGCSRDNLRWFSVELSPLIADYHVHGTKLSSEINNLNGELSLLPQFSWFNFLRFG